MPMDMPPVGDVRPGAVLHVGCVKVAILTPTVRKPHPAYMAAIEAAVPAMAAAGIEYVMGLTVGNPYISAARAEMLHKALQTDADAYIFIDHDISFPPGDLVKLIETPGEVVAGDYRFKVDEEEYMGELERDAFGRVVGEEIGDTVILKASRVPAGFLKVTRGAVERFMRAYPHLCYGSPIAPAVDLFNHGAHEGVWWGEDYAFCRNWLACGGTISVLPELDLTHHSEDRAYPGNLHEFLMRQPGGCKAEAA